MLETRRPPSRSPRLRLALLIAFVAPLLATGRAEAGVTMVMQRADDAPSTLYVDGNKMRMENAGAKERTVIVDAANKRMLIVDELAKTYSEITEADMKRLGDMMAARRAAMEERLKSLPPEQRKLMESKMGPMMGAGKDQKPHELKFERVGARKTINGFPCDVYRVTDDGAPKEEDCLAPWSAGLLQRSDFAGLRKFAEDMAKQSGAMSAGGGHQMFEQFEKYPGFPVSRHPLEAGQQKDEQLKSVKRGSIPAEKFAVPAGFTKTESPMTGALGGPKPGPFKPGPSAKP